MTPSAFQLLSDTIRASQPAGSEALNAALTKLLLDRASTVPDVGSNSPGRSSFFDNKWLSDTRLYDLPDPAVALLVETVEGSANANPWPHVASGALLRIMSMWAIVSKAGMVGRPHNHQGIVSGAYYVDAGESPDPDDGALVVYGPTGKVSSLVRPRSGMLLMWPSTMLHGVRRYDGNRPRIVISFNLAASPPAG